eukprot:828796-Amphidinium_carterae.1
MGYGKCPRGRGMSKKPRRMYVEKPDRRVRTQLSCNEPTPSVRLIKYCASRIAIASFSCTLSCITTDTSRHRKTTWSSSLRIALQQQSRIGNARNGVTLC